MANTRFEDSYLLLWTPPFQALISFREAMNAVKQETAHVALFRKRDRSQMASSLGQG